MGNFTGKRLDNSSFEGKNEIMENDWVCWLECQSSLGAMPAPQMAVDSSLGNVQRLWLLTSFQHRFVFGAGIAEAECHYQTPSDC